MDGTEIAWNYSTVVCYDGETGRPVLYKEGSADSSVALPTGNDALYLADGSKVLHSDTGDVKIYNKKTDSWRTLVTIE